MSQYKGNNTSFEPNYSVAGETKTPINVVATSIEIDGQLVEGYQATYENGTSKWTAHVHQDQFWDTTNVDRSTFTGTYNQNTGKWTWAPTTDKSIENLSNDYVGTGVDFQKITQDEITDSFYNNPATQRGLSAVQADALAAEYGASKLATVENGRFSGLPGIQGNASEPSTEIIYNTIKCINRRIWFRKFSIS